MIARGFIFEIRNFKENNEKNNFEKEEISFRVITSKTYYTKISFASPAIKSWGMTLFIYVYHIYIEYEVQVVQIIVVNSTHCFSGDSKCRIFIGPN